MSKIKGAFSIGLAACTVMSGMAFTVGSSINADAAEQSYEPSAADYGLQSNIQDGVILHCWNWSYNNIKEYLPQIAASGYSAIQTSPVTQPKDYHWEGVVHSSVGIPDGQGGQGGGKESNWWKVYQPVSMNICDNGETWFGTKEEFKEMCAEAEKYGIKVIVDIVANHMGNIEGYKIGDVETVLGDVSRQVGEYCRPDMLTDPSYWHISTSYTHTSDGRFDVTQGNMGMPDLNTGDSKVQQMVLNLLKECIECGADGFRFDAAKHIETPADSADIASSFWDVVLDGADAYASSIGHDKPYYYGEVLNRIDDTNAENYYLSKMSITDNSTGDNIRNSVLNGQVPGNTGFASYIHGRADRTVLWAESHDTYMGGGSSYDANDTTINQAWAIVASRKDLTGLYFARPYYSSQILQNDVNKARQDAYLAEHLEQTKMGDVGTLTWSYPSVAAVNRFHNAFAGQSESISTNGNTFYNVRGNSGVVIVKVDGPGEVSLSANGMADGTYTDEVTGNQFTVSGGTISGNVASEDGIAVVYNTIATPTATISQKGGNFKTESLTLTIGYSNATSATYKIDNGSETSYTDGTTITIGENADYGTKIKVTLTVKNDTKTNEYVYTFTKVDPSVDTSSDTETDDSDYDFIPSDNVVYFKNTSGYKKVTAYMWSDGQGSNSDWPGEAMTYIGNDTWAYNLTGNYENVIFSDNGGNKTDDLKYQGTNHIYDPSTSSWSSFVYEPHSDTDSTTDTETESDIVSDTDTETESDIVSDSDTDTTTDSDIQSDSDTETESDIQSDSDTETESDIQSDSDTETDSDMQSDTDTATDSDTDILIGDMNGDGVISLKDASIIQKMVLLSTPFTDEQMKIADANGDGTISLKDASWIQRKALKII